MTDPIFNLLAVTLFAPFVGAALSILFRGWMCRAIAIFTALVTLITSAIAAYSIYPIAPKDFPLSSLPWLSGVTFGLKLDGLSSLMLIGVTLIGLLVVIYSAEYVGPRNVEHPHHGGFRRYYFWLLIFIGSMAGLAMSPNLLQMFIFWEMTTLGSWALISHTQEEKSLRAGFKAMIMTHLGGFAFIVALLLTYIHAGSFEFSSLGDMPAALTAGTFLLLLVAAWAKSAQLPFHTWLPDAMEAPTPVSAYLHAAAMVKAGVFLVARLLISGFALPQWIGMVMALAAILTMFMAVLAYFKQDDLKRLLAYSTIVHLGYIFVGLALGSMGATTAYKGAVLHILCHGVAKATLFLSVGAIAYTVGTRSISKLRGLATKLPLVGVAYLVGALAATGVPPFSGFWSKFMIFVGALEAPQGWIFLLLLALESIISFGWLLWVGQKIFLGEHSELAEAAGDPPCAMNCVLLVGIGLCLVIPIIGIPLVSMLSP